MKVRLQNGHILTNSHPHKVPPFLATLQSEAEKFMPGMAEANRGCSYCGGLGHRITNCPKLDAIQHKKAADAGRKDYLAMGSADY